MTTTPHLGRAARPLETHLASFGERVALRAGAQTLSYADLAGRVRDVADAYAGERRLVLQTPGQDVDSVVEYLGALAADRVVIVAGSHADALIDARDPDVVVGAHRTFRRDVSAHELHPRPRPPALDERHHRLAQAGATRSRRPARQRGRHRRVALDPVRRRRRDHTADALLLRPVRASQPPARRCEPAAHRRLGPRRELLERRRDPRRHHDPGRPAHLRPAGAQSFRGSLDPDAAHADAGRWPDGPRAGPAVRRARPAPRLRPLRHVRRHGGHGTHERAALRPRAGGADLDRPAAGEHHLPPGRGQRRGRRRARLHRTQRDARLCHLARRPRTGQDRRRASHR
ncbi:hypothetical protein LP418_14685 [Nocardioides sp. B-3]|nr:hypothetical protein [Nocardioides sp. B-3]UUZ57686.1 hypothetical protein LP418_14685 [Nocardioides sp. B-3]